MKLYIKKPNGRHKSYSIYKRVVEADGKTKNQVLESAELENLNKHLDTFPPDVVYKNILAIKSDLEKKMGLSKAQPVFNEDNERVFKKYWDAYKDRDLVDHDSAKHKYERAIRAVGKLSLLTAGIKDIELAVKALDFNRNKKREILSKLKLLLRFLGRKAEFNFPKKEQRSIKYINEDAFLKTLDKIEDPHLNALFYVLFYTGLRIGEAFGLSELKLRRKQGVLLIDTQLDRKDEEREPKFGKKRIAYVPMSVLSRVGEWVELKKTYPITRGATAKRFKKYFGPNLTIHDLRHSCAIRMLNKGASLGHVAQHLGNSQKVCEEYYLGFVLVDESIEIMRKIMGD